MSFKYLNLSGLEDLWINIKNYILSKIPTKTSELINDSGYLTSHQSLANYLTKTTNVSEMGRYIDLHYDNATSKYDYDARLYVDSQGTAAGGGSFKIAAASAYAPAPASNANDTRIATTAWVNSKGYLTSHPSITLSSNTTSTASPAHGGTFTCIDSVTQDTNGHITKVNTKTVTLPSDNNTDTLMTQNVSTTNSTYPILLCPTANATSNQGAKTGIFAKSVKINPSTNVVSASGFSGPLTGNVTGNCSGSSGSCTGNAATATQFSANTTVALTGDATGTSAGSKKGWSVPVTLANSGVTAGTYGPSADVTGNNNATISVPEITVDAKGRVTSVTNRTYTSVNTDTNTDTKVTQTVTTANSGYPVLLCATANATATETTTSRFSAGLTINTRYSAINMTNKYDTANTKGVRNTSTYSNGYIIFRCYDASEMGTIRCESSKNGYQQTYMQAKSYIKNGAISPEGTATTCYITVRVRDNGSKTIYTDGSWENSLTPYANNAYSLGTSSLQWKSVYAKKINNLEPSSLSLPNPSNSIDISAYFTHTKTGETNVYAVPSNGWIFLHLATISGCEAKVLDAAQNVLWGTSVHSFRGMLMIPVVTGSTLQTQWTTEYPTVTVLIAKFYPCKGNV